MVEAPSRSKGYDLEEILRAYFSQSGYLAIRSIPYRLEGDDITDIDLWLYERPAALTRRRIIVDIKNKKSPKATERVIWTRGLKDALEVDDAIVATTDNRPSTKVLAAAVKITLLDGDALSLLASSPRLQTSDRLRQEEFDTNVKVIDDSRKSYAWRQAISDARCSLISGLGIQSANTGLHICALFAEEAALAQPGSIQASMATRAVYLAACFVAVSLDYLLSGLTLRSPEERRAAVMSAIRFGQIDTASAPQIVQAGIGLARKYLENGSAAAKQIEYGFYGDADRIPAEFIADYVSRTKTIDGLFNVARECERSAFLLQLPNFDKLSIETKSFLGVLLDFNGISREKFAKALP